MTKKRVYQGSIEFRSLPSAFNNVTITPKTGTALCSIIFFLKRPSVTSKTIATRKTTMLSTGSQN